MKTANRLSRIAPFKVMELLARANQLEQAGRDVIHLEVGEPDFDTPGPIIDSAMSGIKNGATRYTDARGLMPLREKIAQHYHSALDIDVDPERVFVTAGASGGLLLLTSLLLNSGDNLLMTDPGYPCNRHFLAVLGAEGRLVPVDVKDNYQLNGQLIDDYWDAQTRGVLVASPSNPTGSVLSRQAYQEIADSVAARDGLLLSDEIYQGLAYDNQIAASALSVSNDAFVVNSFSKYFGMTGWRLGWIVVPPDVAPDLEKLAQNLFICPSSVAQTAALAAFSPEAIEIMEAQRQAFETRRDFLVPALQSLGFEIAQIPAGAFYVYARLPAGVDGAEAFCSRLLEEQFVAITPGTDFGEYQADRHVRMSYARDISLLEQAVERIGRMLS